MGTIDHVVSTAVPLSRRVFKVFFCFSMFRLRQILLLLVLPLTLMSAGLSGDALSEHAVGVRLDGPAAATDVGGLPEPASAGDRRALRVVTYNLHAGLGPHWWRFRAPRADVERNLRGIAQHIAEAAPPDQPVDVIGLNEVDFGSRRSGWLDQAAFLAQELARLTGHRYHVARAETWNRALWGMEVRFGNAALVRHPIRAVSTCALEGACGAKPPADLRSAGVVPTASRYFGTEPRGVLRVNFDFHGRSIDLLVTHLDAFERERRERQAVELAKHLVRAGHTTLLVGDMNAADAVVPGGRVYRVSDRTHDILAGALLDARLVLAAHSRSTDLSQWATYPASAPRFALDAVFASPDLRPVTARRIGRYESDHRGLLVQYSWLSNEESDAHGVWYRVLRNPQKEGPLRGGSS